MKQINVPVEDEVYAAAKMGAAKAGIPLKDWVAEAIMDRFDAAGHRRQPQRKTSTEPNSTRQHMVDHTVRPKASAPVSLSDRMRQMREAE